MNTDIRIACTWPSHPKTRKLIRRLGGEAVFALVTLWGFAAQYKPLGHLEGMSAEDIALAAGWEGEPSAFVAALVEIGFLDKAEGGHALHDWAEHQPYVVHAEARSERARSAANRRWKGTTTSETAPVEKAGNATGMPPACREHAPGMLTMQFSNAPSPDPSPDPNEDMAAKPPVDGNAADPCPHQEIIDLYHRLLPMGRQVRVWGDARKRKLRARWREEPKRQNLEWWERFFAYIAGSPFLTGKVHDAKRQPFEIGLDWIVAPENFAKIIEGKYHPGAAA